MKIKLPEKRYFSISELAKRWECEPSDVAHLLEIGELPTAEKLAAIHGKRRIFFGYYGYQINPERPCFLPKESEEKVKYWNETARDDQAILVVPVACDFPIEDDCHFKVYMQFEKQLAEWKQGISKAGQARPTDYRMDRGINPRPDCFGQVGGGYDQEKRPPEGSPKPQALFC